MEGEGLMVRSNWFDVRDLPAFEKFLWKWGFVTVEDDNPFGDVLYGFTGKDHIPSGYEDPDCEEGVVTGDFIAELGAHLKEDYVAIVFEVGGLFNRAHAVNHIGSTRAMDLAEIYEKAKALGNTITKVQGTA
jgi:hypothetical protein